jgi:ABC-type dipeptide/oligopeptide/nickel transport system permease subunit
MNEATAATADLSSTNTPHISETRRIIKVFFKRKIAVVGLAIILLLIVAGVFANWLAPYDPYRTQASNAVQLPNRAHLLGTDNLGRDQLSRIIYGARTSLILGFSIILFGSVVGILLGLIAGYYGGWAFTIIMRFTDAWMCFPAILMMMLLVVILGPGLQMIIIAVGSTMASGYVRMVCGQVMSLRENDYILAGRSIGAGNWRIMLKHLLPNAFPPLIIMMTMGVGMAIMAEAGLSFLGLGIAPPGAAWGAMVNTGYPYLLNSPLLSIAPGVCIMLVVFGFTMMGDGLRDALDPRLRGMNN